jgi:hypothetical protein
MSLSHELGSVRAYLSQRALLLTHPSSPCPEFTLQCDRDLDYARMKLTSDVLSQRVYFAHELSRTNFT